MPRKTKNNKARGVNWAKGEQLTQEHKKAIGSVKKRNEWEKGKTVTTIKHPGTYRAVILKYE